MTTTRNYREIREKHQQEFNELSNKICFYAFNQEQFDEGCRKLGVIDAENELHQDIGGMFCKKSDSHLIEELFTKQKEEREELKKFDDYVCSAFEEEMWNHEYALNYDTAMIVYASGFSIEEIQSDERLVDLWNKTEKKYFEKFEELNG